MPALSKAAFVCSRMSALMSQKSSFLAHGLIAIWTDEASIPLITTCGSGYCSTFGCLRTMSMTIDLARVASVSHETARVMSPRLIGSTE